MVIIFTGLLRNRWIIAAILFIVVVIVVTLIIILLCQPHKGTYTNAWFV